MLKNKNPKKNTQSKKKSFIKFESSRVKFLRPLTPPYVPFGIRRFNSISKYAV